MAILKIGWQIDCRDILIMDTARHVMARNDTNQVNLGKTGYINSNSLSKAALLEFGS